MDLQLKNKLIVVTGGAKGIGKAIVQELAQEGAVPVIIGRDENDNRKVVEELAAIGHKSYSIFANLSDPIQCERAALQIREVAGRVDGLVNNAGLNDGVGLD